jgi:hypothetical protein
LKEQTQSMEVLTETTRTLQVLFPPVVSSSMSKSISMSIGVSIGIRIRLRPLTEQLKKQTQSMEVLTETTLTLQV